MELLSRPVEYFLKCSEFSSLSEAAHSIGLSQSALSMSIKSFEDDLGQKLFQRSKQGIKLTPFGKNMARILLKQKTEMEKGINASLGIDVEQPTIKIGCVGHFAQRYLLPFVEKNKSHVPKLQILLARSITSFELVESGKLDFAFVSWTRKPRGLANKFIKKDPVGIVGAKSQFGHIQKAKTIEDLKKEPWLYTPKLQYDWFEKKNNIEARYLSTSGFHDLKTLILGGYCIAEAQLDLFDKFEAKLLAIAPVKPFHSEVGIYLVYKKRMSLGVKQVLHFFDEKLSRGQYL